MRRALVIAVVLVLLAARTAHAERCKGGVAPRTFATCFDPGNRLLLEAGTGGVGGELALRHYVLTDDPGIWWRFEHVLVAAGWDGEDGRGTLYSLRLLRHSRDSRLVLPTSPPRKLFLPFDIGGEASIGEVKWRPGEPVIQLGMVHASILMEVTRSPSFRRRLSVGPALRWDMALDVDAADATEQRVAPFTLGLVDLHLESADGLTVVGARLEAGEIWSDVHGWQGAIDARVDVERVLLSWNDLPLAAFAEGGWEDPGRGAWFAVGVRFAVAATDGPATR